MGDGVLGDHGLLAMSKQERSKGQGNVTIQLHLMEDHNVQDLAEMKLIVKVNSLNQIKSESNR